MKRKTTTTLRTEKKLKMVMELDPDILLEIFSLLPFKKAVQCRRVCKSWRTLLDDDFLINLHAKTQLKLDGYDHHHAHSSSSSIVSFIYYSYLEDASLFGFYDDKLCSYQESSFNDSSSNWEYTTMIKSSCNGLNCLNIEDNECPESIAIYNPVTEEFLRLPWDIGYRHGGFGYHPSTKEYKILRTKFSKYGKFGTTPSYCHQIYTLGSTTGTWKDIKGSGQYFTYNVPGVHVNGALYWITGTGGNLIMSFDLASEEFRTLTMLPPDLINNKLKLVESQGCLFLFADQYSRPEDQHIELWVLKKKDLGCDHGISYYWSNLMEISTVGHRKNGDYEFLALTHSGKVLFRHKSVLTCFDPKEERFASISDVPASSRRNRSGSAAIVPHTNSLVSLIALGAIPKNKKKKN